MHAAARLANRRGRAPAAPPQADTQGQPGTPREQAGHERAQTRRVRISPCPLQFTVGRSQRAGSALWLAAIGLRGSLGGALLRERLLG